MCGIYCNSGGSGGNVILRNSAGGDGVGWGTYTKGGCAKNSIDSCTKTQTQNNILYRLTDRGSGQPSLCVCARLLVIYEPSVKKLGRGCGSRTGVVQFEEGALTLR